MARRPAVPLRPAPAFPRPVAGFVGRRAEIDRIAAHVDAEVLFLVYGVGGIGKSELVFQLIDELRERPEWRDAVAIHLDVRPGATPTRILAQLLAQAGEPEPRRGQPTEAAHLSEQLGTLARLLEARPHLLFIDDLHHLPPEPVGEALRFLARHVRRSRLFVASRRVIPLPSDSPPPVVTTLGPLDPVAAEELLGTLAERMQVPRPDAAAMMRSTHGSPFHIRRMLVGPAPDEDSFERSLLELSPHARRLLLAVAVLEHRPSLDALRRALSEGSELDPHVLELGQRFLLDREQGRLSVHDLVREPLLRRASADEIEAAHLDSAAVCVEELQSGETSSVIHAADAILHTLAARRPEEAWALVERWHSALASAGSDHLLMEPLERLREALPQRRVAIDLLRARCLVRASLIEDADRVLAEVGAERDPEEEARYFVLSGEVAQRRGELPRAEAAFAEAVERAPDEGSRFQARVHSASVAVLGGDSPRAREILEEALAEVVDPTPRQRARCRWVRTVSWMFEERFVQAAEEARRGRQELANTGLDDLANRLAMVETLAAIECEDMEHARLAVEQIDEAGLRRRVASLYRAIVMHADGASSAAAARLLAAFDHMHAQRDTVNAVLAGHYGAAALAAIGKLAEARALAARASRLAAEAGLAGLAAQSLAQQGLLAAEAVQTYFAQQLADEALAIERIGPRSRATAHCAHAHAFTIEGDIGRALEHVALARAAVAGPDLESTRAVVDIEHAAVHLVGGNLDQAASHAERAVAHYRERSREYQAARARLVLAAAYIARGRRSDLLLAEQIVASARELAERSELRSVQVGCAILSASLARLQRDAGTADELLAEALRELDPERGSLYAAALLAAIEGGVVASVMPGAVALLAHLGFADPVQCYLVSRQGRRAANRAEAEREPGQRELFVDAARSVIVARRGEVEIQGRPMQCALLSELIQARGAPVPPDVLYERVWGVPEYHPLNHRNALYVAINRLRKCLREVLPDREVVLRASTGWCLADDVDACAAIGVRDAPRSHDGSTDDVRGDPGLHD